MWLNLLAVRSALVGSQIIIIEGGIYKADDNLPNGVVTKYFKCKSEVSCVLQCERDGDCGRIIFKLRNQQMRSGECWFVKLNTTEMSEVGRNLEKDEPLKVLKR